MNSEESKGEATGETNSFIIYDLFPSSGITDFSKIIDDLEIYEFKPYFWKCHRIQNQKIQLFEELDYFCGQKKSIKWSDIFLRGRKHQHLGSKFKPQEIKNCTKGRGENSKTCEEIRFPMRSKKVN